MQINSTQNYGTQQTVSFSGNKNSKALGQSAAYLLARSEELVKKSKTTKQSFWGQLRCHIAKEPTAEHQLRIQASYLKNIASYLIKLGKKAVAK